MGGRVLLLWPTLHWVSRFGPDGRLLFLAALAALCAAPACSANALVRLQSLGQADCKQLPNDNKPLHC
jgi:hypothetical protein